MEEDNVEMENTTSSKGCSCQTGKNIDGPRSFIFSIGSLSLRFPSVAIENEFRQRERMTVARGTKLPESVIKRSILVLRENEHLARNICIVQSITGIPAYIVLPATAHVLDQLLSALEKSSDAVWTLLIGRSGGMAPPTACNGILAPYLICDTVYVFTLDELLENLSKIVTAIVTTRKWSKETFKKTSEEVFRQIVNIPDNLGANDGHRALNYFATQHPGPYIAVMERTGHALLHRIDTLVSDGPAGQILVTIVMNFVDRMTGVPERLATTIDVTEEWPFVVESNATGTSPIGMIPYVGPVAIQ